MKTPSPAAPTKKQFTNGGETESASFVPNRSDLSPRLYSLISEQPFFKGLSAHQFQLLADSSMEIQFKTGQSILQAGDPANRFYLILEGKVALEAEGKERGTVLIRTLGPGEILGWSWLFPPYYLHFSARAIEPVRTIFFYGTRLRQQCEEDHELGYELMKRAAEAAIQSLDCMQQRFMECADAWHLPREGCQVETLKNKEAGVHPKPQLSAVIHLVPGIDKGGPAA